MLINQITQKYSLMATVELNDHLFRGVIWSDRDKLARGRSSGVKGKNGGREREKREGEIKNGKWADPSGVKEIMKLTGK